MKTDAWLPFYVGDYLRDTMHLSTEQHGAYFLLILNYWTRGSALPDDDLYLARVCGLMADAWQSHKATLMQFFEVREGRWFHKRIESELVKAVELSAKKSNAGKSGAYARWHGKGNGSRMTEAIAAASQSDNTGNATAVRRQWQNDAQSQSQSHRSERDTQGDQPIELPPGFPKTDSEAKCHSAFIGCPDAFTLMTWNKAVSRGGCDAKDIPIRNFRAYLAAEWSYEQNRKHRQTSGSNKPNHPPRVDRSAGTANEGRANDYANLGQMVVAVRNPQ